MKNIGTKIKDIRKRKGYSQEELAEFAKVNLRTIQRIESGESEPRGTTLNLICSALGITTEAIFDYGKQENNHFLVLFHLSVLAFIFIPLGNIILPLILFFSKKEKIQNLNVLGANVLSFQIIWTVLMYTSLFVYFFTKINHIYNYQWSIYLFFGFYIFNIIAPIFLAIATNKKKKIYKYPVLFQIIK
jgi:transcriptional regulator with XRE-family HTH domain